MTMLEWMRWTPDRPRRFGWMLLEPARVIVGIGAAAGVLAALMPWAEGIAPGRTGLEPVFFSGIDGAGDGVMLILLAGATGLLTLHRAPATSRVRTVRLAGTLLGRRPWTERGRRPVPWAAMPRDRDLLVGTLAAITAAALFGMLGLLARFGEEAGVSGVAFTAWRALLGASFLAVLIVSRRSAGSSLASLRGLSRHGRLTLATAAIMGVTLNVSVFTAFGLIPIALALMVFYTYPAGVAVVDVLLGHERVTPSRVLALGLSSVGVVLVLAGGIGGDLAIDPLGIVLGLVAGASQVVFMTVSRTGYRALPADAATFVILATSVVGASFIALLTRQADGLLAPFQSLAPWPFILLAGVAGAGVSSLLFLTAIRAIGGTRTGILMLLEPVVGVVLAGLLLGEAMGSIQAIGGALVLAGALVLQARSGPGHEAVVETAAGPIF